MKVIKQEELIKKINDIKGASFVSVDVKSEPRMRKTDNPYVGTVKIVRMSCMINFDYANAVNNQLQREGKETDFVAKPRKWGVREGNWITHKGAHYLTLKIQDSSDPIYLFNDVQIDKSKLAPFLQESNTPHTQEDVDEKIIVRDVKLENIKIIRMAGEEYVVVA